LSALLLACLLAAQPAPTTALERASAEVGEQLVRRLADATASTLAVAVSSPDSQELSRAAQTTIVSVATARGFKAVLPLRCPVEAAEDAARAAGSDSLLRLTVRIEGADVTVAGDLVPTWVNFWAGKDPVRKAGGGPIAARVAADAQVLTLAHLPLPRPNDTPPRIEIATRFSLRSFARIPERVVALAIADLDGDKQVAIVALTASQVLVLKPSGQVVSRHDLSPLARAPKPPREPAGGLAIESAEGGRSRLLAFSSSRAKGEVLELQGGELKVVQSLEQPAVCSGEAGVLRGSLQPGRNQFAADVRLGTRAASLPFGPVTIAANPRAGAPAFVAVSPDGAVSFLDAELKPSDPQFGPLGAAIALGDLDGDGTVELVTSLFARADDRLRLTRLDGKTVLFESEVLPVNLVAAAAGDLLGDGRDVAVVAGWAADGSSTLYVLGAQR